MSFPQRPFFTIHEVSDRWGCPVADVRGWAAVGHLSMVIGVASVICGASPVAGIVTMNAADMMQMFRRHGPSEDECRVHRISLQGSKEWQFITQPETGVSIKLADLLLRAEDVLQFEEDRNLRRPPASTGTPQRYDWEGMNLFLFRRFNDRGLPATQAELIVEVQDWFAQQSHSGDIPEESTIRKRLNPIWRELRGSE